MGFNSAFKGLNYLSRKQKHMNPTHQESTPAAHSCFLWSNMALTDFWVVQAWPKSKKPSVEGFTLRECDAALLDEWFWHFKELQCLHLHHQLFAKWHIIKSIKTSITDYALQKTQHLQKSPKEISHNYPRKQSVSWIHCLMKCDVIDSVGEIANCNFSSVANSSWGL